MWVMALVGCGMEVLTFSVTDSREGVVEGVPDLPEALGQLSLDELVNLDGVSSQALATHGVSDGDLSYLQITDLSFTLLEPVDGDLAFLQGVEVWLSADALGEIRIASGSGLADGQLVIDVTDEDLAPYLLSDGLVVSTFANGLPPTEDLLIETTIAAEFGVTAKGAIAQLSR